MNDYITRSLVELTREELEAVRRFNSQKNDQAKKQLNESVLKSAFENPREPNLDDLPYSDAELAAIRAAALKEINETTIERVLDERSKRYGEYSEHARITQALKDILKSGINYWLCSAHQRETLDMIAHKLGRIVNGDPDYIDSWLDIEGYTRLTRTELEQNDKCPF